MARTPLYPEGSDTMNVVVPSTVKSGLQAVAIQRRQSVSALVTVILEDWLKEHAEPEAVPVA